MLLFKTWQCCQSCSHLLLQRLTHSLNRVSRCSRCVPGNIATLSTLFFLMYRSNPICAKSWNCHVGLSTLLSSMALALMTFVFSLDFLGLRHLWKWTAAKSLFQRFLCPLFDLYLTMGPSHLCVSDLRIPKKLEIRWNLGLSLEIQKFISYNRSVLAGQLRGDGMQKWSKLLQLAETWLKTAEIQFQILMTQWRHRFPTMSLVFHDSLASLVASSGKPVRAKQVG